MKTTFKVPIRNLFCMLSYANDMPELVDSFNDIDENIISYDFLARRFNQETELLLRRGLMKSYISYIEPTNRLGGRLLMNESMTFIMEKKPTVICEKDEYSSDILLNQIMKATLEGIYGNRLVSENIRKQSFLLWELLPDISAIHLKREMFMRITYNRLNIRYKQMINLARLFHEMKLLSHKSGEWSLFNVELDDQALNRVFEKFLLRFYQVEQKKYKVQSEKLQWKLDGNTDLLPGMQTDVSLMNKNGLDKIIIDAKYYKNMFQEHFGKQSFHSHNMYQLFTYLMHQPEDLKLRGILIYPYNSYLVNENYRWNERVSLEVVSVDLGECWERIHEGLISIIEE